MKAKIQLHLFVIALVAGLVALAAPGWTQNKPTTNMQILREKIKADKKLLVAVNMELTKSEAEGFWPIYESYQKDLGKINQRLLMLLKSYAADFRKKTLTDPKAQRLIDDFLAIQKDEVKLMSSYVPKLNKVLTTIKVARYIQLENKIRAVVKFDLARGVPLMQ